MANPTAVRGKSCCRLSCGSGREVIHHNVRSPFGAYILVTDSWMDPHEGGQQVKVFVEVQPSRSTVYGYVECSVGRQRWEHLIAAVKPCLQMDPGLSGDWRIDVIVDMVRKLDPEYQNVHFENAVA